ncbi:MAG TPA: acyl transferase [Chitinophagaceae bacterium]|nr:acyl transferase [Chitinophagaceae bacterium]
MVNTSFINNIFDVSLADFENTALEVFHFQYNENKVYRQFVDTLKISKEEITSLEKIPFLPISFFKTHIVKTTFFESELVFESSGTTQMNNSHHHVKDEKLYKQSFLQAFEEVYGNPEKWCILGLLPSYLERKNSSLVFMVNELINQSKNDDSGFYLNEWEKLYATLKKLETARQPVLLFGVTFALLDFFERYSLPLHYTTIIETGGMKGRKDELTRAEVHAFIQQETGLKTIHSEYGMTEMLSQAYSKGKGVFECPGWMRVLVRDEDDPLQISKQGRGVLNIVDLANVYSCSFIATDDAGTVHKDGAFEVLGRVDNSDIRGCSLMAV